MILALLILAACSSEQFEAPDIKDDFCGVHINYQYCKCAFHNDFCNSINMDRSEAKAHVNAEYDKWVDGLLQDWLAACAATGGIPGTNDCTRCDEGYVASGDNCVPEGEEVAVSEPEQKQEFKPDGPLNADCSIKTSEFEKDWRKYSDIDERIDFNERSFEAKQALTSYDEMIEKMVEAFALERDIEIETQMLQELKEYKSALVKNIKTNLLKSFWRLSWVTYTTVKGGQGLGDSYSQVLTSGGAVESIGAGLKVVQGVIPGDSSLAIDTNSVTGKAKSVGANVALEAVDSLGDPVKIATELFKSAANAPLPSADISPEEIAILKEQHIENGLLDQVIAESKETISERKNRLKVLETQIMDHQKEIGSWEAKEKDRVARSLESSCLELKKQAS